MDGVTTRVPKEEREKRLVCFLAEYEAAEPAVIGYAFYDHGEEGLDVLGADEYPEG